MTGILFAFITALGFACKDVLGKKILGQVDEYVVTWSMVTFGALSVLVPVCLSPLPELGPQFWPALVLNATLNLLANVLYYRAIRLGELSLAMPLLAFTPLFMLLTSPLFLHEFPTPLGIVGVLLIVVGSYVLNLRDRVLGIAGPFVGLAKNDGARLAFLVAFIWSICAVTDKVGVQNSSPLFWAFSVFLFLILSLTPLVVWKSRLPVQQVRKHWRHLVGIGVLTAVFVLAQFTALTLTLAAYVIAVKRLSVVFSVIFGTLLFNEEGFGERISGAVIMFLGVALITLSA